jgi:hypothetical protein
MTTQCQYPNCRQVVATIVVIEIPTGALERFVCITHRERAQAITKQHQGFAYRLRSA